MCMQKKGTVHMNGRKTPDSHQRPSLIPASQLPFSEALKILDRNMVQYMIEQQQDQINQQRGQIDQQRDQIEELQAEIARLQKLAAGKEP